MLIIQSLLKQTIYETQCVIVHLRSLFPKCAFISTAARVIKILPKYCHITLHLKDLHWLPICHMIVYKIAILVHKGLHGRTPTLCGSKSGHIFQYFWDVCGPHTSQKYWNMCPDLSRAIHVGPTTRDYLLCHAHPESPLMTGISVSQGQKYGTLCL